MSPSITNNLSLVTDMALPTEGGLCSGETYKPGPPDEGEVALSWITQGDKITATESH